MDRKPMVHVVKQSGPWWVHVCPMCQSVAVCCDGAWEAYLARKLKGSYEECQGSIVAACLEMRTLPHVILLCRMSRGSWEQYHFGVCPVNLGPTYCPDQVTEVRP
jgi:hypothetical protein